MSKLLRELTEFFTPKQQSALENFINSKHPTNAAEVDFWQREFETSNTQYWGRGL